MKYFKFSATTEYCGADNDYYYFYDDKISDMELARIASEIAYENALEYQDEEDGVEYFEGASCTYEEISKEEYNEAVRLEERQRDILKS